MLLINKSSELSKEILKARQSGKKINFVPTMGNIHAGHLNLVEQAKRNNGFCIVSIFINPLQFSEAEDFKNYPRTTESDKLLLSKKKVDLLYIPNLNFVNKLKFIYSIGKISEKLCGMDRKGHFEGVATVIIKFLKIIDPDFIYLGEKDFQQILVIKKIINDFNFKAKVEIVTTSRDEHKVALSSRNELLKEKIVLLRLIPKTLETMVNEIYKGSFKLREITEKKKYLLDNGIEKINYFEILKEHNLEDLDENFHQCRIFISVVINEIRLIDNMPVGRKLKLSNGGILELGSTSS